MFGPWIRMDSDLPPRSLERLLHLRDRLRRLEGVILREVAEVCGRSSAIVQSGVGGIKGYDCGDLLGQGDGHVERVGASQREADEGELAATVRQMGRSVLAQDLHRFREPVADLPKRLRQSPPGMQDQHPWSAAMFGNGQIGADRSPISLKFSHTALLFSSQEFVPLSSVYRKKRLKSFRISRACGSQSNAHGRHENFSQTDLDRFPMETGASVSAR